MLAEFSGKVWENGEFGIAMCRYMEMPEPFVDSRTPQDIEDAEWTANLIKVHGVEAVLEYRGMPPLGFSPLVNSHKEKIRGRSGITGYGKRVVRNACYRLEREVPRERLTFATFTLPDVSRAESLRIAENWSTIVKVFVQKLRRRLLDVGLPAEVVGVTEIQEQRSMRDGILGLHLHLVFVGRLPRRTWALDPCDYRLLWMSVICPYLNSPQGFPYDWTAVENVQRVKKSVESYLGKYISKGAKSIDRVVEEFGYDCLPTAWHTVSRSLRSRAIGKIRAVSQDRAARLLEACLDKNSEYFVYRKPIEIDTPSGNRITVGWMGKIKPEYIVSILGEDKVYGSG